MCLVKSFNMPGNRGKSWGRNVSQDWEVAFQKQNSVVGISQDFTFIAGEENLLHPSSIP